MSRGSKATPFQNIIPKRIINAIRKSTMPPRVTLAGIRILGKYTFLTMFDAATTDPLPALKAEEKNCHGNIAERVITEYQAPLLLKFPIRENTKVRTTIVMRGRTTAHATPSTVCL